MIHTSELDSPLNKINSISIEQSLLGKIFNYGTIRVNTASSFYCFNYVKNPKNFQLKLNEQIEQYDEDRINKQAEKLASAMK